MWSTWGARMRGGYLPALVSVLCGASAAAIAAVWGFVTRDTGLAMPLPAALGDREALLLVRALAVVFQLGVPALSVMALIFAIPGWREPMGKAGLLCAVFALTVYAATLAAMAEAFAA